MLKAALILAALVAVNGFSIYQPLSCDNALDLISPYNNLVAPLPYSACQPQPCPIQQCPIQQCPIQQCRVQQVQAAPSVSCVPAPAPQTVCVPAPAQQTVCVPAPATNPATPPINANTIITLLSLLANNPTLASNSGLLPGLLSGLLGGSQNSGAVPMLLSFLLGSNAPVPGVAAPGAPAPGVVQGLLSLIAGLLGGVSSVGGSPVGGLPILNGTLNGTIPLNPANPSLVGFLQQLVTFLLGNLGAASAPTTGAPASNPLQIALITQLLNSLSAAAPAPVGSCPAGTVPVVVNSPCPAGTIPVASAPSVCSSVLC